MKDKLTIVIPSKNEREKLYECLDSIAHQHRIDGVTVIIADISDDQYSIDIIEECKLDFINILDIKVIKGGYPSEGRLAGSKLVKTPYILFLDADIILLKSNILFNSLNHIKYNNLDLVTIPFRTDENWNWVFYLFNIFQKLSIKLKSPFAVGGFQLWSLQKYWELGGYNPLERFAEDYSLSSKVNINKFGVYNFDKVYTSPRRFENKGFIYMFMLMIRSYINKNNPKFFINHHNYWN